MAPSEAVSYSLAGKTLPCSGGPHRNCLEAFASCFIETQRTRKSNSRKKLARICSGFVDNIGAAQGPGQNILSLHLRNGRGRIATTEDVCVRSIAITRSGEGVKTL
jgi:hypothetical protein